MVHDLEAQRQRIPNLGREDVVAMTICNPHRDVGRAHGGQLTLRRLHFTTRQKKNEEAAVSDSSPKRPMAAIVHAPNVCF